MLRCVVVCDLETSRIGAPYIYDISRLRVKKSCYLQQHSVLVVDRQADSQRMPQFGRNAATLMGSIKLISEICDSHDKRRLFLIW